ncbi:SDR family oxidoreductase [Haliovirga abyssi]|uniref:Short-chain dehydrogenase/reductase n=1 Tax=Haliovirga abyssi TaxID=2996794 RepID=A0AAU9DVQ1_9FUSO|nr:SDR family oxidoreductase [Haliovirga abyssi]BDU51444.1 short-chain dehydrogenase/reductase [Haliovirga abyssi]
MNKTIFVTGSSSGIGKETVKYFQKKGWNVAATMRSPEKEKELNKLENVKLYKLDVTDNDSILSSITSAINDFGKIDVLLNNAGFGTNGIFEAATDEQIYRQFNVNVFGVMRVIKGILPHFKNNKSGTIVNISSMGGLVTIPLYSLYHSTKFAIEGFIESLQFELATFNIKLKLIEPGAIKTDFYSRSKEVLMNDNLSEYKNYFDKVTKNIDNAGNNGLPPIAVAKKIYKAVTDNSNRLRYSIGKEAPYLIALKRFIPNWIVFKLTKFVMEK